MTSKTRRHDELELLHATPSSAMVLCGVLMLVLAAVPLIILAFAWPSYAEMMGAATPRKVPFFVWLPFTPPVVLVLPFVLNLFIGYFTQRQVVTSQRVRLSFGLLAYHQGEVPLENIESVYLRRTMLGRLLGYGTVVVCGVGGTKFSLRFLEDPLGFARILQRAHDAVRNGRPLSSLGEAYGAADLPPDRTHAVGLETGVLGNCQSRP